MAAKVAGGDSYAEHQRSEISRRPNDVRQPSQIDFMRQAIYDVYGDNNLGSLGDDAYVQRKWRAAMMGSRGREVAQAYRNRYQNWQRTHFQYPMSRDEGATHTTAKGYGIPDSRLRAPYQGQQSYRYHPVTNHLNPLYVNQLAAKNYWGRRNADVSTAWRNSANMVSRKKNIPQNPYGWGSPQARETAERLGVKL